MEETAPLAGAPVALPGDSRGTTQTGVRLYNERLILSLIRRHRSLGKVRCARLDAGKPALGCLPNADLVVQRERRHAPGKGRGDGASDNQRFLKIGTHDREDEERGRGREQDQDRREQSEHTAAHRLGERSQVVT